MNFLPLSIYKASAGSGKTFTLTREYLTLLLGYQDKDTGQWHLYAKPCHAHRHILAITFTNMATDEMSARIISQLAILGRRDIFNTKPSDYEKDLCNLFRTDPDTLAALASATLDDLLFDYAYFHVQTIDTFFQTVLRTFAREVDVPDDFELQLDDKFTISLGVSEMLLSLNSGPQSDPVATQYRQWLTDWLEEYMTDALEQGKTINPFVKNGGIQANLVSTFSRLLDEKFRINSHEIITYLEDLNRLMAFKKALSIPYKEALDDISSISADIVAHPQWPDMVNRNLRTAITQWSRREKTANLGVTWEKAMLDHSVALTAKLAAQADPQLTDLLSRLLDSLQFTQNRQPIMQRLPIAIMRMGLLGCVLRFLDRLCKENNLILLSDTSTILRDIITDDDTPFVYERLGYYLNHFLIDEFQDTSAMQWQNMRPMLLESLSRAEHDLIIGDEKQCIYRFRNSDPELLGHKAADELNEILGYNVAEVTGDTIDKNTNWRSSVEVVTFNNTLFRTLAAMTDTDDVYSGVVQRIDKKNLDKHGFVKVQCYDPATVNGPDYHGSNNPPALLPMISEISRMLSQGYRQKDIAILVRGHAEGAEAIQAILALNSDPSWPHGKMDVTSVDSMTISQSVAVRMIISVLRLALQPEFILKEVKDPLTKTVEMREVLNPRWRYLRFARWMDFFSNAIGYGSEVDAAATRSRAMADALAMIADEDTLSPERLEWRAQMRQRYDKAMRHESSVLNSPTLFMVVEQIIDSYLSPALTQRDTIFITALQDMVLDFMESSGNDIAQFIDWWDRSGHNQSLGSLPDTDAITVMTIHKSKGLEFPCVIIPKADWDIVTYNSPFKPSYGWYACEKSAFPDIPAELVPPLLPLNNDKALLDIPAFATDARIYRHTQIVDNLNVAYVALTRAVDELIVMVPESKAKPGGTPRETLAPLIIKAISDPSAADNADAPSAEAARWLIDLHAAWDPDTRTLTFGFPTDGSEHHDKERLRIGTGTFPSILPSDTLPHYKPALNYTHTQVSTDDIVVLDFDDPRQRGIFIHSVLQHIPSPDRLDIALKRKAYRAHLTDGQRIECRDILVRALSQPNVQQWISGYSRLVMERPIATPLGLIRPDRVVWTADGHIDVVDYKTGHDSAEYHKQVTDYVAALRAAGYDNVRGFLWFVTEATVVRVI